jgi:hypothetical protein
MLQAAAPLLQVNETRSLPEFSPPRLHGAPAPRETVSPDDPEG